MWVGPYCVCVAVAEGSGLVSFVGVVPDVVHAAVRDFVGLGEGLQQANVVALEATVGVLPAAGDEVSAAIAALFGGLGREYQAAGAQAALFHQDFVQLLGAGVGAYEQTEQAAAGWLERFEGQLLDVVNAPSMALLGRPMIGDGVDGGTVDGVGQAGGDGGWLLGNGGRGGASTAAGVAGGTGGAAGLFGTGGRGGFAVDGRGGTGGLAPVFGFGGEGGASGNSSYASGVGGDVGLFGMGGKGGTGAAGGDARIFGVGGSGGGGTVGGNGGNALIGLGGWGGTGASFSAMGQGGNGGDAVIGFGGRGGTGGFPFVGSGNGGNGGNALYLGWAGTGGGASGGSLGENGTNAFFGLRWH